MWIRRYEVRQVGKWGVKIEDSEHHSYRYFTLSAAKRQAKYHNDVAEKLELIIKYRIFDKLADAWYD